MVISLRSISWLRAGTVALLLGSGACADDAPNLTTEPFDTTGDVTTTDSPTTASTIDPDTTAGTVGMDSDTTRGETDTTTDAPTTDAPTTDGPTTTEGGPECGNGMIETGEDCESEDLDGQDCESQGFVGGRLLCSNDCTFDTSMCTSRMCGNDMIEGTEECDGADLGGATCVSEGFEGGMLACADDCTLDTNGCVMGPACGNGAIEMGEECDGVDLGGEDCVSQGFMGGALACAGDCSFDTSGCMGGGGSTCCSAQMAPGCDNAACEAAICGADAFCCSNTWDQICADAALADPACAGLCGGMGAVCGDGMITAPEPCDGANLNGEDCVSQGFAGGGVLACAGDCSGFDTSGCMGGGGSTCCSAQMAPGCDDAACEASICGADAFCCSNTWDQICADAALADPACAAVCGGMGAVCGDGMVTAPEECDGANLDGQTCVTLGFMGGALACSGMCAFDTSGCMGGGASTCCSAQMAPGCDNAACEAAICGADPFCCSNTWDQICADAALASAACAAACP